MTTATTQNASDPVILDSSGWLEYLTTDTKADLFAPYFEGDRPILVPAIVLYEVRKVLLLRQMKDVTDIFLSEALRRTIIPIDEQIALFAAAVSIQYRLAMADALLYATSEREKTEFVTSDPHFKDLPRVTLL
jgi:predicted nucleic acid-binding protein